VTLELSQNIYLSENPFFTLWKTVGKMEQLRDLKLFGVTVNEKDVRKLVTGDSHRFQKLSLVSCRILVTPRKFLSILQGFPPNSAQKLILDIKYPTDFSLKSWKTVTETAMKTMAFEYQVEVNFQKETPDKKLPIDW
jgi:hypothetical protein